MKFTNYILRPEVIILGSDTNIYSLERNSFSGSSPSSHPFQKFSDNAFDSRYEDTCNSDDSWEPTKAVNKITSKSVLKGKHGTSSVSFKGRKGSTSRKGSCSKSTKTKPCKVLKFLDDSSSDDHEIVLEDDSSSDDHDSVFKGKLGSSSKGVGVPKHSRSIQSNLSSCCKTVEADVELSVVSLPDVVEAKKPPPIRNYILRLASLRMWQKGFWDKNTNGHVVATQEATSKGKRNMV
nr:hypothetical protein [Tanacetum cinerariifolium]